MTVAFHRRLGTAQRKIAQQILVRLLAEADVTPLAKLRMLDADLAGLQVDVVEGEGHRLTHVHARIPQCLHDDVVA